ncbi:hypothetical protein [Candidatus Methylopumilus planktonicus]|uniref:hypothetical protein n=1 Tax=Candidatus Methylopumilus planktonicus TaxID=1581557 RepID=UPI003BEEC2B8
MNHSSNEKKANLDNTSTFLYKKENEYVMSLPRVVVGGAAKRFYPDSVLWLFFKKINTLRALKSYFSKVIFKWSWLAKTKQLRNSGLLVNAIVIGNGPSQGYLDAKSLLEFKSKGGEVICVNFWTDNEELSKVIPTYLVTSDPLIFSEKVPDHIKEKNAKLLSYMLKNVSVMIICPLGRCDQISKIFGKERVLGFVDEELRMWTSNINPMYPRGYLSMTLYKALAMAIWINYKKIFIIGMDNTYSRNIYCDQENKFINHEIHAGTKDFSFDQSNVYKSVGDGLTEIAQLFYDARKFNNKKILNLDPYSLTDAFIKMNESIDNISDVLNANVQKITP